MVENCTIGYFKDGEDIFAGKNREPGKDSLDIMIIRSPYISSAKLMYIGVNPEENICLHSEIEIANYEKRILTLKECNINLYSLKSKQKIPKGLKGILSDNVWGGLYPDKRVGMSASAPARPIYLLPGKDHTVIGNASHYNLERLWGGINSSGLFVQSSSIRHDNRLKNRPSYSIMINDLLEKFSDPRKAIVYLEKELRDFSPGAANFLVANGDSQYILEFLPPDVTRSKKAEFKIRENLDMDFRTNFGLESKFFKRADWDLSTSESEEEIHHFIRSLNRLIVAYEDCSQDIFKSHKVYPELFDKKILQEFVNIMYNGDLKSASLIDGEDFASFYSICTHPIVKDDLFPTYKRTFWNMFANLTKSEVLLSYDNPCQSGAKIEISPLEIEKAIKSLS